MSDWADMLVKITQALNPGRVDAIEEIAENRPQVVWLLADRPVFDVQRWGGLPPVIHVAVRNVPNVLLTTYQAVGRARGLVKMRRVG